MSKVVVINSDSDSSNDVQEYECEIKTEDLSNENDDNCTNNFVNVDYEIKSEAESDVNDSLRDIKNGDESINEDEVKSENESIKEVKSEDESENDEVKSNDSSTDDEEKDDESESDDEAKSEEDYAVGNAGWADSVSKILKTNKPKGKKTLVLSKAKKLSDVKLKKPTAQIGFEIENEIKEEEKPDLEKLVVKEETEKRPLKRKRELPRFRVKPNILDKDHEKTLAKIATSGVVQLFNSVQGQQKNISNKLDEAGPMMCKREKVLKNIDKRQFLNVLMGEKSKPVVECVKEDKEIEISKSSWNVLRDDFMMGGKMKDWDKNIEEELEEVE